MSSSPASLTDRMKRFVEEYTGPQSVEIELHDVLYALDKVLRMHGAYPQVRLLVTSDPIEREPKEEWKE